MQLLTAPARNSKKTSRASVTPAKRIVRSGPVRRDHSENSRNLVNSLSKGLRVLEAFTAERSEMTLSEVAMAAAIDAGTAFRMLNTLVMLGYVARTPEGKRFIDFNSQLMCVNIGHGDPRVIKAIQDQAATLAYANPFMATEPRALLGQKLASICPGDINVFFFTNGGAEAAEPGVGCGEREAESAHAGVDYGATIGRTMSAPHSAAQVMLTRVPMMNRSRASGASSSENRPRPLIAMTAAMISKWPTAIAPTIASRSR